MLCFRITRSNSVGIIVKGNCTVSDNSLWGDLSSLAPERTPSLVLGEQASLLQGATNEILLGRTHRNVLRAGSLVVVALQVIAPALQQYSVEILQLSYKASMPYPVSVRDVFSDSDGTAESEHELRDMLRQILTSDEVRTILASLIAESQLSDT